MKIIYKYRIYLRVIAVYAFYLVALPYFNQLFYPCLKYLPGTAYEYHQCNLYLVLDRFMLLSLVGMGFSILYLFFSKTTRIWSLIIITSVILTAVTIFAYLEYIKLAESQIREAPIYLDSLPKTSK